MKDFVAIASGYVRDVVTGRIVAGRLIRLACERFERDRKSERSKRFPYRLDAVAATRACAFIELLPHVKGEWARNREPLTLEPWQVFLLVQLFGWIRKSDGKRRFRKASLYVARKNGKSLLAAGIALYCLAMDEEPGAEVYCGATTEQQAWEVFRPAKQMAEKTPDLGEVLGVQVNARTLFVPDTGSRFAPLIGKPGDGASPSCAIIDEYHEHPDSTQYDAMLTGMGARSQPILLVVSTAGETVEGPCRDDWQTCERILEGQIQDEEHLCLVYAIDPEDDWADPAALPKANPNIGVSVTEEFLRARIKEAVDNARHQQRVQIKHCNRWVGARNAYFNVRAWDDLGRRPRSLEDLRGRSCFVGLDLAARQDLAAVQVLFPPDGNEPWYTFGRYYLPEAATEGADRAHFAAWVDGGHIVKHDDVLIDFDAILADILEFSERFRIVELGFDQWQATQLVAGLMKAGVSCVQIPQTTAHLSQPMKELDALIKSASIEHDGNPCMSWMMGNVTAKTDANDNVFPRKERPEAKIDGPAALINALARGVQRVEEEQPEYSLLFLGGR